MMSASAPLGRFGCFGLGLLVSACVEPPTRSELLVPPSDAFEPPVLSVGQRSSRFPTRLGQDDWLAIDDSCVGAPRPAEAPARQTAVLVYDWVTRARLQGWCVTDLGDPLATALECDPSRDPITDYTGNVRNLPVGAGPVGVVAQPPASERDEHRGLIFFQRVDPGFWGRGYPGAPTVSAEGLRLEDLVLGRAPSPRLTTGLMISFQDCSRLGVYGARAELVGRRDAPIYGDGGLLPSAEQPWTHVDGAIRFEALEVDAPTWITVRLSGRRTAEADEAPIACFEVPVRPRMFTFVFAQLGAVDSSTCEAER